MRLQAIEVLAHLAQPALEQADIGFDPGPCGTERPKAGRSRPSPVGIKQSGKATFA